MLNRKTVVPLRRPPERGNLFHTARTDGGRYLILPAEEVLPDGRSLGPWIAAESRILAETKSAVEAALKDADLADDVVFEASLEIGALVVSSSSRAIPVIKSVPEVGMVVED